MSAHQHTALVTGAGRGIGRATALALARSGLALVVTGRHAERLQTTVDDILREGGQARAVVGSLSDERFWLQLREVSPQPLVVVHNASQPAPFGPVDTLAMSDLQGVLDSVLGAGLRLAQQVLPSMKAAGFGRLIYVGSAVSDLGAHGQVAYATAKSGLRGLVRSVALEASRQGITCNLVEPGFIDTERTRDAVSSRMREALGARAAVGRAGTAQEVADVIAFLASPAASYVTGAVIPVTGGIELGLASRPPPLLRPRQTAHDDH